MALLPRLAVLPFTLLFLGCTGGHRSGDRAGTINWTMTVLPATPSLIVGQSVQFSASTPWGNEAQWSVLPTTAGLITPGGLFTAANTPGPCTVYAVWSKDAALGRVRMRGNAEKEPVSRKGTKRPNRR